MGTNSVFEKKTQIILIASLILVGYGTMYNSISDVESVNATDVTAYSQFDNVNETLTSINMQLTPHPPGESDFWQQAGDVLGLLVNFGLNALLFAIAIPGYYLTIISVLSMFGFPGYVFFFLTLWIMNGYVWPMIKAFTGRDV